MKKILIIGATSAIAQATAQRYAAAGARLYLLARDPDRLDTLAQTLRARGAHSVEWAEFDADDIDSHAEVLDTAIAALDGFDIALVAYGTLGHQAASQASVELTLQQLHTDAISVIALLTHLANYCESLRYGTLAVITSVAGDRGRQSNYVYGTAKAAVSTFLQGLRNRLYHHGVHVLTIKPGFVDTPMTAGYNKGVLWATPEQVAIGIENAIDRRRNVAYVPGWWRLVMLGAQLIPEAIFKRLKL